VEICPDLFFMHLDGLAYVKDVGTTGYTGSVPTLAMATGLAVIPDGLLDSTIESADDCPGECIFIQEGE
jgi:ferredoxin